MKSSPVLVAVLALITSAAALDREAFTITNYDLNLRVEPAQQRLGARGQIRLRNDSPSPQRLVVLQISSSLNWRSIRLLADSKAPAASTPDAGQAVQFLTQPYTSDIDHTGELSEAIITLPREISPKDSVELGIGYEGVIILDATRLKRIGTPDAVARHSDWDQIGKAFTTVRGAGYVTWYPLAMEAQSLSEGPAMFAALGKWKARHAVSEMKLSIEIVPNGAEKQTALVNGKDCVEDADATTGLVKVSGCAFDRFGWANPVFVLGAFRETVSGAMRLHILPADAGAVDEFGKIAERASYLTKDWFGAARETVDVVDLGDAEATPFEAGNWLLLPLAKANPSMEETLIVHQLTHAALASPRPWIAEGTAHFAQVLAAEKDGRDAALEALKPHRKAVAQAEQTPDGGEAVAETMQEVFYRSKAALVWWMLCDMVGDAALKRVLHLYKAADDTDPSYLQNLLESESKRGLGWFFHDWVYTDAGLPTFAIESANARHTTGTNFVTAVTVTNNGGAGAEVPVTVRTATGEFVQRLEVRAKGKAVTRIATPAEPLEVTVNDGSVPEASLGEHRLKIAADETK